MAAALELPVVRLPFASGVMGLLIIAMASSALANTMSEDEFRATLLYNLLQFVKWPADARSPKSALRLCVAESETPSPAMAQLAGKTVQGQTLVVLQIKAAEDARTQCDCLWIGGEQLNVLDQVALYATSHPILIVAEGRDAVARGAAIGITLAGGRARLAIGSRGSRHPGLEISARLQQIAAKEQQ